MKTVIKRRRISLSTRIATWNVRTMAQAGKIHGAIQEMERMGVEILGVCEMRWPGAGSCVVGKHTVYYSGSSNTEYKNGVGIIVNSHVVRSVSHFVPVSERL